MSITEFELPEELQDISYETILADMKSRINKKYDKTEGGFIHDMVAPSALEAAELVQLWLTLGIKTNFHMWAKGRWLDYHARNCGLIRRPATYAYGDVSVTTTQAVTFPEGFIFSVPGENSAASLDFESIQEYSTDSAGTLTLRVKAVEAGVNSNVAADSITIMKNPLKGVAAITNPENLTGGTAAEDDDSLRQRIDDFYAGRSASFVGNRKDYERWAKDVPGVGFAHCIPTFAGANTVKLVICDANGDGANQEILDAVEQYIFGSGHDDINRLAPIGIVQYEVAAPAHNEISVSMNAKIAEDFTVETVKQNIVDALKIYFKSLADSSDNSFGTLYYVKLSSVLTTCAGLEDFKHLRVKGGLENISFAEDEMPTVNVDLVTLLDFDEEASP